MMPAYTQLGTEGQTSNRTTRGDLLKYGPVLSAHEPRQEESGQLHKDGTLKQCLVSVFTSFPRLWLSPGARTMSPIFHTAPFATMNAPVRCVGHQPNG